MGRNEEDREWKGVAGAGVSRRHFLQTVGALGLAAAGEAVYPARAGAQAKEVVVASWGGAYTDAQRAAFFDPFEKETGIKVVIAEFTLSKLKLMVESGKPEWDLITGIQGEEVIASEKDNLLEKIDYKIVPMKNLVKGTAWDRYVVAEWYTCVVGYSPKAFPKDRPKSWADFWNLQKFPGARAMAKEALLTLVPALLADGVDPNKLFPLDYDRAFRSLDRIKPHVNVWYSTNAQPPQLIADGQVVMSSGWNGRFQSAMDKGAPIAYTWNQGIIETGGYAIPRGAKNGQGAMQLIAYALDPKRQAVFAKRIPYGVTNTQTFKYVDPETAKKLPTAPENRAKGVQLDFKWLADHLSEMTEKLNKYLIS